MDSRMVPEISSFEINELVLKKYRIVYCPHEQKVEILTALEGCKLLRIKE